MATNLVFNSDLSDQVVSRTKASTRILQVVGSMDCGGTETWLMHVLRHIDRQRFRMDFLVHTDRRCFYDAEIEMLGSRIRFCPTPSNPLRYQRNFLRILREYGPYDVVHSHVHHFSGFVLKLAKLARIRKRIAHSHCNITSSGNPLHRQLYMRTVQGWIHRHASLKLAASRTAAESLFGPAWQSDPNTAVLHCGLDFDAFKQTVDPSEVRAELGLTPNDFVIGHVGRFIPTKNHDLLLRIHAEILRSEPRARLLLVGKGELESSIRTTAERMGTAEYIRFPGVRTDIARLMLGAMDAFVLPSLHEGLGLVAIEAQAAGLPTVLSDKVPLEADTSSGLVRFVSLQNSTAEWAQAILHRSKQERLQKAEALAHIIQSQFNIKHSTKNLCQFYAET